MALQITIYLNEADTWLGRPLHQELLDFLKKKNIAGATLLPTVTGYTRRGKWFVDTKGKHPVLLTFIDTEQQIEKVLPTVRKMAGHRLIVSEKVKIEQGLISERDEDDLLSE